MSMRVSAGLDVWALPVAGGMLVGKGTQVHFRLKSGAGLFDLWTALRALVADRSRGVDELVEALSGSFPAGVVRNVLPQLLRVGLLASTPSGPSGPSPSADDAARSHPLWPYVARQSSDPAKHIARLIEARVALVGSAPLVAPVAAALTELGIAPARTIAVDGVLDGAELDAAVADATVLVAVASNAITRLQLLPAVNAACTKARRPWLATSLDQDRVLVGPLFVPGETACFHCLELREESHLPNLADYRELRAMVGRIPAGGVPSVTATALAAQTVASELIRFVAELSIPTTYRALIELDLVSLETTRHPVLKVALCDVCGPHVERPFRRAWSL
jgi:bacteriocin biosynthesis cyclodehydratase domain-containing protein